MNAWAALDEFPGYEASMFGDVRSVDRWVTYADGRVGFYRGTVLEQSLTPTGSGKLYFTVTLTHVSGRRRNCRVANLVLAGHVGPKPFPKAVARHLNDDQFDNRLVNLMWGSQSQNMLDRYRNADR